MRTLAVALLMVAIVFAPAVSAQDKEVQLKISLWLPPAHPLVPATKDWAADIEKESGGTIKSTVFPSEQLGKAFDHYVMARDGIADVTYVNPGYQPGRFRRAAFGAQEGDGAGRSEEHEGAAGAEHHRPARHHARRHQRAGLGAGIA